MTQTQKPEAFVTTTKETPPPPPAEAETKVPRSSLIDDVLENTIEAQRLNLIDRPDAVEAAGRMAQAIDSLRIAAVKATAPEQYVLWKSPDGVAFAALTKASSAIVRQYFKITIEPDGPPRKFNRENVIGFEVTGQCWSDVTEVRICNLRGKRLKKEDFRGRAGQGGVIDSGDEDLMDAARTSFDTKCTALLTGLVRIPLPWLVEAWGLTIPQIEARASKGKGYGSSAERKETRAAQQPARSSPAQSPATNGRSTSQLIGPEDTQRIQDTARTRAKYVAQHYQTSVVPRDIVTEVCDLLELGIGNDLEKIPADKVEDVLAMITVWGDPGPGKH